MTPQQVAQALVAGAALSAVAVQGGEAGLVAAACVLPAVFAPFLRGPVATALARVALAAGSLAALVTLALGASVPQVLALGLSVLLVHQRLVPQDRRAERLALLLATLALVAGAGRATSPAWLVLWAAWALGLPVALGGVVPRARWRTAALALGVVGLGVALFLVLPRWSRPPGAAPTEGQIATGLSDHVALGDLARLADDPTPVARVRFDGPHDPPLLRVTALEAFDGRRWASTAPLRASPSWAAGPSTVVEVAQETLGGAVAVPGAVVTYLAGGTRLRQDATDGWHAPPTDPVRYTARVVDAGPRGPDRLDPATRARDLALPAMDADVVALARSLVASAGSDRDRIAQVASALATMTYTRDAGPPAVDPTRTFLLERRAGYCEHFASAATVLLRLSGVPARVVVGFAGGVADADGVWTVRRQEAHAWVEAHLDGVGWVVVDPTPPPDVRAATQVAVVGAPDGGDATAAPGSSGPPRLAQGLAAILRAPGRTVWQAVLAYDAPTQQALWTSTLTWPPVAWALATGAMVLLLGAARRRREAGATSRPTAGPRSGVAGAWDEAVTALAARGVRAPGDLPPVAASQWLAARAGAAGAPLVRLGWLHALVRFGGDDDASHQAEARTLVAAILRSLPENDRRDATGPIPGSAPPGPTRRR
ncbi:MAG: DUF3488 domain-containing protein [Alphaproteobacteria bacterium]|nr:DUF3488 domain-containing protein [Alphaproteobacteria bacterium]